MSEESDSLGLFFRGIYVFLRLGYEHPLLSVGLGMVLFGLGLYLDSNLLVDAAGSFFVLFPIAGTTLFEQFNEQYIPIRRRNSIKVVFDLVVSSVFAAGFTLLVNNAGYAVVLGYEVIGTIFFAAFIVAWSGYVDLATVTFFEPKIKDALKPGRYVAYQEAYGESEEVVDSQIIDDIKNAETEEDIDKIAQSLGIEDELQEEMNTDSKK